MRVRRVCLLAGLLAVVAGNLCANPAVNMLCTLTVVGLPGPFSGLGSVGGDGCFSTAFSTVTNLDSLDWGAPSQYLSGSGQSGLGPALPGNAYPITNTSGPDVRTVGNVDMQLQRAPTGGQPSTSITRVDDLALEWNGTGWQFPGFNNTPNVASFAGHFGSNAPANPIPGHPSPPPPGAPAGDHLVELPSNGSSLELTLLNNTAYGVWFRIGSLTCLATSSYPVNTNCLFDATIQAFDSGGASIGTYTLAESGTYGSGGVCTGLSTKVPGPVPCNDSPYVGFYDPDGRIKSIYISVFNHNGASQIGFAIDSLYVDPVPEPAMPLLIGGGLAAIALYGRKRRSRLG